ncbi:D-alanyl-D-alanine carboxypeptidase [Microbacterium sp. LTA6]|uniref:D-alanyl-D-alanine carboxypeptidase family protein n=1 Tax=unclassified Microbacterium TaxID=2609290 RepID=UPI0031388421
MTLRDARPDTGSDAAAARASIDDAAVAEPALSEPALSDAGLPDPALPDVAATTGSGAVESTAPARWADAGRGATALTWVDPATIANETRPGTLDGPIATANGASLLKGARLRSGFAQPQTLVPLGILAGLVTAYAGTTLLWPLHEIAPTVQAVEFEAASAPPASLTWPTQGSAAVGVEGVGAVASALDEAGIASITKVVSTLMVLDRLPLAVGEQGPEYSFTLQDSEDYWDYRIADQSSLDVPVGGTLTEFQMLQGILLGSANNYIDRLSDEIWGSERAFADAAEVWLRERGLEGITVVTPSGFDEGNTATPEALVKLAQLAMENPVFASIVGTKSVDIPGVGVVTNGNGMLADAGVVGIKTGTLEYYNLLTAKDVPVGDITVRLYAAVLGQNGDDERLAVTRTLFAEAEAALQTQKPTVPAGTVVGEVQTVWGESAKIVTDADAAVILWNAGTAEVTPELDLGDTQAAGDVVGTLTATGPLNTAETKLTLADELAGPSPWWRLTHPLELFGIAESAQR